MGIGLNGCFYTGMKKNPNNLLRNSIISHHPKLRPKAKEYVVFKIKKFCVRNGFLSYLFRRDNPLYSVPIPSFSSSLEQV